jgi:ubiquitin carboxyl-terminal hydrolase 14
MGTTKVSVKWGKEVFADVEVDLGSSPLVFKSQLFALSGVPPVRQKVMIKGSLLKDDDWGKATIKDGANVMLMGTADPVSVEAPVNLPKWVEDLPESEQEHLATKQYGAGLENLGNTCYMNSTVQCMYAVEPLRKVLFTQKGSPGGGDNSSGLMVATRDLFRDLERGGAPFSPYAFLMALRARFPQFAETGPQGAPMQQDAEECWRGIMSSLREKVKVGDGSAGTDLPDQTDSPCP